MAQSSIEWTDASWNPIRARNLKTGKIGWHCEHVTTGCEHCYAEGINRHLGTGLPFKPGHRADIEIFLDEKMLLAPLKWLRPRRIFVGSMTDLFADFVTDDMLDRIFAVMALCPQHTFQVLTKRAERLLRYLTDRGCDLPDRSAGDGPRSGTWTRIFLGAARLDRDRWLEAKPSWPLPNVWLGISCERQEEADERIPLLLQTPAAVRFISVEPLLGAIDLTEIMHAPAHALHALWGLKVETDGTAKYGPKLDWVIVGGESGPNARPMHPDWARSLHNQCHASGVAFFFKQWGEWAPTNPIFGEFERVGKKAAGRRLDGREHNAFPQQRQTGQGSALTDDPHSPHSPLVTQS